MTDRIEKVLQRLSPRDRKKVKGVLVSIVHQDIATLDIKKLHGRDDVYRVRVGDWRVLFTKCTDGDFFILAVERRSETTYEL